MDFKNFEPCLLIAMPELQDPNFQKAVVLLTDYSNEGASGFIINRRTAMTLSETLIIENANLNDELSDMPLHQGGPVDNDRIWVVYDGEHFQGGTDEDTLLGENIYIARNIDVLVNPAIRLNKNTLRVYHGYSGWGAGQLDQELAVSAWITAPLKKDLIFAENVEEIWASAIKDLGITPDHLIGSSSGFVN